MSAPVRIAMWSGPRNISTAMMRAFENRPDTLVWDEPFYAAYLAASGIDHPMREAVLASDDQDWRRVVERLVAPLPAGISIHYQKHMTHHMLPEIGRDWIDGVTNAFLIRRPDRVLASYARKRETVSLADVGFVQQGELFDRVAERRGAAPPVVDADDVLGDPKGTLTALCRALGVPFSERMLSWPPGLRDSDGVWAAHWYQAVAASTGFAPPPPDEPDIPAGLRTIADAARPVYERLRAFRLKPAPE